MYLTPFKSHLKLKILMKYNRDQKQCSNHCFFIIKFIHIEENNFYDHL